MQEVKVTRKSKLDKMLSDKGLTYKDVCLLMEGQFGAEINPTLLKKMANGEKHLMCTLHSNRAYPMLLERLCIVLGCMSSDLLEY